MIRKLSQMSFCPDGRKNMNAQFIQNNASNERRMMLDLNEFNLKKADSERLQFDKNTAEVE